MGLKPVYTVLSRAEALAQIIGGYAVDGGPGQRGPGISRAWAQVIAGTVIREIAAIVNDPRLADRTRATGADLIRRGGTALAQAADGDGPPWRDLPWPLPWPPKQFDPRASIFAGVAPGTLDPLLAAVAQRLADTAARPSAGG